MTVKPIESIIGEDDSRIDPAELESLQKLLLASQEGKLSGGSLVEEIELRYKISALISSIKNSKGTPQEVLESIPHIHPSIATESIALLQMYIILRGGKKIPVNGLFDIVTLEALRALPSSNRDAAYQSLTKAYEKTSLLSTGEFIVSSGENKYGLLNPDGKTFKIPVGVYDFIEYADQGYYRVKKGGQTGLLKSNGTDFLIPLNSRYSDYEVQWNKTIVVWSQKDRSAGLLSADGKTDIIPIGHNPSTFAFARISVLKSGLIYAKHMDPLMCRGNGPVTLLDETGAKSLLPEDFDGMKEDPNGKYLYFFSKSGCGIVSLDYKIFSVKERKFILPNMQLEGFSGMRSIADGIFEMKDPHGSVGILGQDGNWIIDPRLRNERVLLNPDGSYTVRKENGTKETLQGRGNIPTMDKDGRVRLNGKYGYLGLKGEMIIPAEYDKLEIFRQSEEDKYFLIRGIRGSQQYLFDPWGRVMAQGDEIYEKKRKYQYNPFQRSYSSFIVRKGNKYSVYQSAQIFGVKLWMDNVFSVEADAVTMLGESDVIGFIKDGAIQMYSISGERGKLLSRLKIPKESVASVYRNGASKYDNVIVGTQNPLTKKRGLVIGDHEVLLPLYDNIHVARGTAGHYVIAVQYGDKSGLIRIRKYGADLDIKILESLRQTSFDDLKKEADEMALEQKGDVEKEIYRNRSDINDYVDPSYNPNGVDANSIMKGYKENPTLFKAQSILSLVRANVASQGLPPSPTINGVESKAVSSQPSSKEVVVDKLQQGKEILKEIVALINGGNVDKLKVKERIAAYEKLGLGTAKIRVDISAISKLMTEDNITTELGTGNFEYVDGEKGKISISALKKYM